MLHILSVIAITLCIIALLKCTIVQVKAISIIISSQFTLTCTILCLSTQLWDTSVGKLVRRMWSHNSRVGSISWNPLQTDFLSSGSQTGHIHHYDIRMAHYHTHSLPKAHSLDVCGLKWSPNGRFLASGGNDNLVNVWDLYGKDSWSAPLHTIKDHTAAVKVLKLFLS